jgi:SAM-dependent methyltransferase
MTILDTTLLGERYVVHAWRSLDEFRAWGDLNGWFFTPGSFHAIAQHALAHGIDSAFLGHVGPEEMSCASPNYREDLVARRLNARQRAVLDLLTTLPACARPNEATIYATEALTDVALALRGRFIRCIGSEYARSAVEARALFPIVAQDLAALTFPDRAFDAVICNEVIEHLPDLPASLAEMSRVLKRDGVLLATFPFLPGQETSIVKARLIDGRVVHYGQPEFHGNPTDPEGGSLVFQVPAWDIIPLIEASGFARAEMLAISSREAGITAGDAAGILVLVACNGG